MSPGVEIGGDGAAMRVALGGARLSTAEVAELAAALRAAGESAGLRLVVVAGPEGAFCAGRAPNDGERELWGQPREFEEQVARPILDLYAAIDALPVPVLAAVDGPALGLGCALAVACDITIATTRASFAIPEIRVGLPPLLAVYAMRRAAHPKALARLAYGGGEIDAREAVTLGLVGELVEPGQLAASVEQWVDALGGAPAPALAAVKRYLGDGGGLDPAAAAALASRSLAASLRASVG